jgi:hypothetical protein
MGAFAVIAVWTFAALACRAQPLGLGGAGSGYATYFEGFGQPYGGCGVPQSWTADDNGKALPFVALNTFDGVDSTAPGLFAGGKNCGRWLRMTPCVDCKGGSSSLWRTCIKGDTCGLRNYASDALSGGGPLYGYVADSCGDMNLWCRQDRFHVDVSQAYLQKYVSAGLWGNRVVNWEFVDGPPAGWTFARPLKFGWAQGAYLPYYPALIVHGTTRGVSRVQAENAAGVFVDASQNGQLGQMHVLRGAAFAGGKAVVRVFDHEGKSYGGDYTVTFTCKGTCAAPTKA